MQVKNIGIVKALQKIKHFCAYQERNHKEVKQKLYSFGLYKVEVETILSELIADNYLNEERFAVAFAGGKFRQLKWGKVKIKYALQQHGVSEYCVKKALKTIDEEAYGETLKKLYNEKLQTLTGTNNSKQQKVRNYLLQKGYSHGEIACALKDE